ncbi:MAG: hypothetical protein WAS73_18765 [Defluviicoccus sp.]
MVGLTIRRLVLVTAMLALVLPAAGCGRKDQPEPPPGSEPRRSYPAR